MRRQFAEIKNKQAIKSTDAQRRNAITPQGANDHPTRAPKHLCESSFQMSMSFALGKRRRKAAGIQTRSMSISRPAQTSRNVVSMNRVPLQMRVRTRVLIMRFHQNSKNITRLKHMHHNTKHIFCKIRLESTSQSDFAKLYKQSTQKIRRTKCGNAIQAQTQQALSTNGATATWVRNPRIGPRHVQTKNGPNCDSSEIEIVYEN